MGDNTKYKPMLSVERDQVLAVCNVIEVAEKLEKEAFLKGTSRVEVGTFRSLRYALDHLASVSPLELRALLDKEVDGDSHAPKHQGEPVALQHMAVSEGGVLRWMTGRKMQDCELYAMPDGSAIRSKLYAEQPAPVSALITDEQILETMRPAMISADGGYVFDTAKKDVIEAGRALLAEVARLNGVKP